MVLPNELRPCTVDVPDDGFFSVALTEGATTFWQANTWYYPVDVRRQKAVAVQFQADRVVKVDILG